MERRKLANRNSVGLSVFSEDIMTEIFLRLPVKSLIRFKRLSKRWYFLISHKRSYFRSNYLSNRIVGSNDDDYFHPIMAGFFYQRPEKRGVRGSFDPVRFLPSTCTQFKKYNIQGQGTTTTTTTPTLGIENNINPCSSLDNSLGKFLSCCLHRVQDSAGVPKKIFIAASSNGFLLCSLECRSPETYYLINPVTMEWATLPRPETIKLTVYVGFVCKGNYPSLDTVEYTIVRLLQPDRERLLFQFFSSGDNQWREYSCSFKSLMEEFSLSEFSLSRKQNPVIVSTATNSDDQGGGGGGGIVVYFLVTVRPTMASAIAVFDLNKGDNSLQMIETPGLYLGEHFLQCADYISEFDDGVIHYVRICCLTDFEFWVLNTESKEWCLEHRANLMTMVERYPCLNMFRPSAFDLRHIHAFHPMNPNLIFLTMFGKMVCYNVQTETLELIYDFNPQNMLDDYSHYVYQWPCWPPLL